MRRKFIVCMGLIVFFALRFSFGAAVASPTVVQLWSPNEFSPGTITIDFEGLSGGLTNQIPGLAFHPWQTRVVDPAVINNSLGISLSAATSGTAAAHSAGSRIDFSTPVTEVGMFISPSFITFISGYAPIFRDFSLVALDSTNTLIGVVTVPVLVATGSKADIESFTPVFLGLKSDTPIATISVDAEFPQIPGGSCFFFDDLVFVGPQGEIKLIIEEVEDLVAEGILTEEDGSSLIEKLQATIAKLNQGKTRPVCNILQAFINQVQAYLNAEKLSALEGQSLIDAANSMIDQVCG